MDPGPCTRPSLLLALRDVEDHAAWTDFVALYTPLVFRQCLRSGLQPADAEDITQEVMRSVTRSIQQLDYDRTRGTFRGWLLTTTRNRLRNFFTRDARHPRGTGDTSVHEFLSEQPSPEADSDTAWETDYHQRLFEVACQRVRGDFQPATWTAFWQTAVEERPVADVASGLGLSPGAVYVARSRVTARLRQEIHHLDGDESTEGTPA